MLNAFEQIFTFWINALEELLFSEQMIYFTGLIFFVIVTKFMLDLFKVLR